MRFKLKIAAMAVFIVGTQAWAQTTYVFTTCGATGATGPSQAACDAAYSATNLNGLVTVSGGIQQWTVPSSGTYRIAAVGAQGENPMAAYVGGRGAKMEADIALTGGQVLQIVVGQMGIAGNGPASNRGNGGGGGGSFVVDMATITPLIIAGGGGGTRAAAGQNGCDGRISQEGGTGIVSTTHDCSQKVGGIGFGGIVTGNSWGSGGGGFLGDGQGDPNLGQGGFAFVNGAAGGIGLTSCGGNAAGGFGSGGAGNGCWGGGGGGGYSGGDGGLIAGGGGSFISGANQFAAMGVGIGDGSVSITILDSDGDGVDDANDYCPDTVIPEGVPTVTLNPNRWALTADGNGFDFDTVIKGNGNGPNRSYTIEDTAGCSCEQIVEAQALGDGHLKHGCSISAMDDWVALVNP